MPPPKNTTPMKKTTPPPPPPKLSGERVAFAQVSRNAYGHRTVLYGPGGVGKTTLTCKAVKPGKRVAFVDLDDSLSRLSGQLEADGIEIPVLVPATNYQTLRLALRGDGWDSISALVVDSGGKLEEWVIAETLRSVKHEKGHNVSRLEDYGYGKGYQHVYEIMLPILADFDRLASKGVNVILVCHDCVSEVPNPNGGNWIRYEPRLQNPGSGKASIRLRVKEWADHVLFYSYDVAVDDNKKAKGNGTRTLYRSERPPWMAKSRTGEDSIDVDKTTDVWSEVFK